MKLGILVDSPQAQAPVVVPQVTGKLTARYENRCLCNELIIEAQCFDARTATDEEAEACIQGKIVIWSG